MDKRRNADHNLTDAAMAVKPAVHNRSLEAEYYAHRYTETQIRLAPKLNLDPYVLGWNSQMFGIPYEHNLRPVLWREGWRDANTCMEKAPEHYHVL